jgi:hypothetical protein
MMDPHWSDKTQRDCWAPGLPHSVVRRITEKQSRSAAVRRVVSAHGLNPEFGVQHGPNHGFPHDHAVSAAAKRPGAPALS